MWEQLNTIGSSGSEDGEILADEEYKNACRITLEKCKKYYAITCGVYGGMVHTGFCDAEHFQQMYHAVKKDLQEFIDADTSLDEELESYARFASKY